MNKIYKYLIVVFLPIFSLITIICLKQKYTTGNKAIVREIEHITGVSFPRRHENLEAELATEFCYVGKMHINRSEITDFLQKLKFHKKDNCIYLNRWGKYKEMFQDSEKTRGFLYAIGTVEGKNFWEFAYDPESEELWFLMGYVIPL